MKFATTKSLQRDYGLPFATAETIYRAQMKAARQHYRLSTAALFVGFSVMLACTFAPDGSLPHRIGEQAWLPLILGITVLELLIHRRAQAPILAAARAAVNH